MSFVKWRPFCLNLNVLRNLSVYILVGVSYIVPVQIPPYSCADGSTTHSNSWQLINAPYLSQQHQRKLS